MNFSGELSHAYGSDGAGTTLLTAAGAVLPADFTASVNAAGTVLTIHQISTNLDVLEISLSNTTDGVYTVRQLNPISHPAGGDENNLQFSIHYVVTDGNGDTVNGTFAVDVDDDSPTRVAQAAPITATVLEAGLSTAAGDAGDQSEGIRGPGETTDSDQAAGVAGSLTSLVSVGADAPLTFGLSSDTSGLPTLFSHGELLVYQVTGNVLTASVSTGTVFTLQVNANGSWSFDLDDQLDHVEGNGANLDLRTTAEGSTSVGAIDFSSIILATDADGDSVNVLFPGDFTVAVRDDVPTSLGEPIPAIVLEDGLSLAEGDHTEGNREGGESLSSDETSGAPGSLTAGVLPGADEPLTFSLAAPGLLPTLFSHGEQVNYQIVGNTLTASTLSFGQVFTLTVNIDGSWSFDLTGQLDHVDNGLNDENFELRTSADGSTSVGSIDFTSLIQATDADGDSIPGRSTLSISVQDDGPTANNDLATQTAENQAITINVFANDVAGADGVNLTTGVAVATGPSQGTLAYNNNGSFTYTPNANAEGADSFSYTITDGDGDTSTATVSITLAGGLGAERDGERRDG